MMWFTSMAYFSKSYTVTDKIPSIHRRCFWGFIEKSKQTRESYLWPTTWPWKKPSVAKRTVTWNRMVDFWQLYENFTTDALRSQQSRGVRHLQKRVPLLVTLLNRYPQTMFKEQKRSVVGAQTQQKCASLTLGSEGKILEHSSETIQPYF